MQTLKEIILKIMSEGGKKITLKCPDGFILNIG